MSKNVEFAQWLFAGGAGVSGARMVGSTLGAAASRILRYADERWLQQGTYALLAAFPQHAIDGIGIVARLSARCGRSYTADLAVRTACDRANAVCREVFAPKLPWLQLDLLDVCATEGPSLGLPALLAMIAHWAPTRTHRRPVLATGEIAANGDIAEVGHMSLKLAAARAERSELPPLILVPPGTCVEGTVEVRNVWEAIKHVFGEAPLQLDRQVLDLEQRIEQARGHHSWSVALELLDAVNEETLRDPDRARLQIERGTVLRHLGRSKEADAVSARALALLEPYQRVFGPEAYERFALQKWLTAMDECRLEECIEALTAQLAQGLSSYQNEVRYRGALAQALAMSGRPKEALAVRAKNLALHPLDSQLAKSAPGTFCYLALDAARSGDEAAFHQYAARLIEATELNDDRQCRYNAAALVRGWVALGEYARAIAWASGKSVELGVHAPGSLPLMMSSCEPISEHPEVSTARALCRAMRKTGDLRGARRLSERAGRPTEQVGGLVAWLSGLLALEGSLALDDASRPQPTANVRDRRLGNRDVIRLSVGSPRFSVLAPALRRVPRPPDWRRRLPRSAGLEPQVHLSGTLFLRSAGY